MPRGFESDDESGDRQQRGDAPFPIGHAAIAKSLQSERCADAVEVYGIEDHPPSGHSEPRFATSSKASGEQREDHRKEEEAELRFQQLVNDEGATLDRCGKEERDFRLSESDRRAGGG